MANEATRGATREGRRCICLAAFVSGFLALTMRFSVGSARAPWCGDLAQDRDAHSAYGMFENASADMSVTASVPDHGGDGPRAHLLQLQASNMHQHLRSPLFRQQRVANASLSHELPDDSDLLSGQGDLKRRRSCASVVALSSPPSS
jgi:hypothetical protein